MTGNEKNKLKKLREIKCQASDKFSSIKRIFNWMQSP